MVPKDSVSTGVSTVKNGLTPQQIQQFKADGFLIIRDLLPREAVQPLIDELARQVDEAAKEAVRRGVLDPENTFEDAPFETRLAQVCKACTEPDWVWHHYFSSQKPRSAGIFTLRTAPALLDVVESLMGPEILAHPQFNYRAKLPDQDLTGHPVASGLGLSQTGGSGGDVGCQFLDTACGCHGREWVYGGKCGVRTVWGCCRMAISYQRRGIRGAKFIADMDLPPCEVVAGEVDVGDALMTTERLVHRSIPNRSDTVRWSVDTRYNQIGLPTGRENVPRLCRSQSQTS